MLKLRRTQFSLLAVLLLSSAVMACAPATPPPTPVAPPTIPALPSVAPTEAPPTTAPPATTEPTQPPATETTAPTSAPATAPTVAPTTVVSATSGAPTMKLVKQVNGGFAGWFGWSADNKTLTAQLENNIAQYSVPDLQLNATISTTFAAQVFALSPDGSKVVGMAQDNSIQIWNVADSKSLVTLQGATQPIGAMFSPDGTIVALDSADKIEVDLYDAATGKPIKTMSGFETAAPVYSAMLSPDNKTLAWISRATVQFQDVASGKLGATLKFEDFVGAADFTPDSQSFVTADTGSGSSQPMGVIQVWNIADGKEQQRLSNPQLFNGMSVSPTGTYLATAVDKTLLTWDWKNGGDAVSVDGTGQLARLDFSNDGKWLATGDQDGNIALWQAQ